mmetsp:Transcript_11536/g.29769  ORF Transcript_11536/g.29769 Transcript_11536/m.29769 type:complete len:546 (-) Transcript_11536:2-1639(-)
MRVAKRGDAAGRFAEANERAAEEEGVADEEGARGRRRLVHCGGGAIWCGRREVDVHGEHAQRNEEGPEDRHEPPRRNHRDHVPVHQDGVERPRADRHHRDDVAPEALRGSLCRRRGAVAAGVTCALGASGRTGARARRSDARRQWRALCACRRRGRRLDGRGYRRRHRRRRRREPERARLDLYVAVRHFELEKRVPFVNHAHRQWQRLQQRRAGEDSPACHGHKGRPRHARRLLQVAFELDGGRGGTRRTGCCTGRRERSAARRHPACALESALVVRRDVGEGAGRRGGAKAGGRVPRAARAAAHGAGAVHGHGHQRRAGAGASGRRRGRRRVLHRIRRGRRLARGGGGGHRQAARRRHHERAECVGDILAHDGRHRRPRLQARRRGRRRHRLGRGRRRAVWILRGRGVRRMQCGHGARQRQRLWQQLQRRRLADLLLETVHLLLQGVLERPQLTRRHRWARHRLGGRGGHGARRLSHRSHGGGERRAKGGRRHGRDRPGDERRGRECLGVPRAGRWLQRVEVGERIRVRRGCVRRGCVRRGWCA